MLTQERIGIPPGLTKFSQWYDALSDQELLDALKNALFKSVTERKNILSYDMVRNCLTYDKFRIERVLNIRIKPSEATHILEKKDATAVRNAIDDATLEYVNFFDQQVATPGPWRDAVSKGMISLEDVPAFPPAAIVKASDQNMPSRYIGLAINGDFGLAYRLVHGFKDVAYIKDDWKGQEKERGRVRAMWKEIAFEFKDNDFERIAKVFNPNNLSRGMFKNMGTVEQFHVEIARALLLRLANYYQTNGDDITAILCLELLQEMMSKADVSRLGISAAYARLYVWEQKLRSQYGMTSYLVLHSFGGIIEDLHPDDEDVYTFTTRVRLCDTIKSEACSAALDSVKEYYATTEINMHLLETTGATVHLATDVFDEIETLSNLIMSHKSKALKLMGLGDRQLEHIFKLRNLIGEGRIVPVHDDEVLASLKEATGSYHLIYG